MNARAATGRVLAFLLDLVYPKRCGGCAAALPPARALEFCETCQAALPWLDPPFCRRCGDWFTVAAADDAPAFADRECARCRADPPPYAFARSALRYEGPVRAAVQSFKFDGRRGLGGYLAGLVVERLDRIPEIAAGADAVISVPLHRRRQRERGFNQADALAAGIAARTSLELLGDPVERTRPTPPQVGLNRTARIANMRHAFTVRDAKRVEGRTILVVDDVMTTGATVAACAKALRDAGAREVRVLTIARG